MGVGGKVLLFPGAEDVSQGFSSSSGEPIHYLEETLDVPGDAGGDAVCGQGWGAEIPGVSLSPLPPQTSSSGRPRTRRGVPPPAAGQPLELFGPRDLDEAASKSRTEASRTQ